MARRIALLAGAGALVGEVVQAIQGAGDTVRVFSFSPRSDLAGADVVAADLSDPLRLIGEIRGFGATQIVMAGGLHISDAAREGLARVLGSGRAGQSVGDASLAGLGSALQALSGAELVGVHELTPQLLAPEGLIAGPELADAERESALFALRMAREIGRLDMGQGVVVAGRRVVAAEDIGGTDALLARVGRYRELGLVADGRSRLILAKAVKPGQPRFADLPAIGATTVENAGRAGVAVIAVEAGGSILIGRDSLASAAGSRGVTVIGLSVTDD